MDTFRRRLDRILREMPLSYHVAGDTDAEGNPWEYRPGDNIWGGEKYGDRVAKYNPTARRSSATEPLPKRFKAWSSPKFLKQISAAVSRLTSHNILIYVGGNIVGRDAYTDDAPEEGDPARWPYLRQSAARRTGIDPTVLRHSIVVNIANDGGGVDPASPWIILHQVAEALSGSVGESAGDLAMRAMGVRYRDKTVRNHGLGGGGFWEDVAHHLAPPQKYGLNILQLYHELFKFGSARKRMSDIDFDQELLTEYLWHGHIRVDYPREIPKPVVRRIKEVLERICVMILDSAVGKVLSNNPAVAYQ